MEAAERRKDAQVARDYRIPLPFGLTDQQAGDLAEEMARFICRELYTAVSLGLHRDADVDALGQAKPVEKVGFHAHLYFPTRRLEDIQGEDGASDWGLGAKLVLLSNKNTSGAFVERLNEKWASLANRYTSEQGLPADYTHLSYARQDLPITPQPTLGAAVTAMERRGFFSRRGDALRGDIMVPAKVYEAVHAIVLEEQHRQAVADVATATVSEAKPEPEVVKPAEVIPSPTLAPVAPMQLSDGEPGSLVARFRAAVSAPETSEAHQLLARVLRLVQAIEWVLGVLAKLADRFRVHEEDRGRRMVAKLDTDYQLDEARRMRAATRRRLADWEDAHPLLMFLAKKSGSEEGKPVAWRTLRDAVQAQECRVQEIKETRRRHHMHLDAFNQEAKVLKQEEVRQKDYLGKAVGEVQVLNPSALDTLTSVAHEAEQQWLKEARSRPASLPNVQTENDLLPPFNLAIRARRVLRT